MSPLTYLKGAARFGVNSFLFGLPAASGYEMYRYARKRRARGGRSYAIKRRRLTYRRTYPFVRRYRRKRFYRRKRSRLAQKPFTAYLRVTKEIPIAANTDYNANFCWSTDLSNQFKSQVLAGFGDLYDQYKLCWIKRVYTMLEPSTLTDEKSELGAWYRCFDLDGDGKLFDPKPANFLRDANCRWGIAKPFTSQTAFIRPKFALREFYNADKPIPMNRAAWFDIAKYGQLGNSYNSVQMLYSKVPQGRQLLTVTTLKIQFRGFRNGSQYVAATADAMNDEAPDWPTTYDGGPMIPPVPADSPVNSSYTNIHEVPNNAFHGHDEL